MPTYNLPYGAEHLEVRIPEGFDVDLIEPIAVQGSPAPATLIEEIINSKEAEKLFENHRGAARVAIAINDKTRPVPHQIILPPLLRKLETLGLSRRNINLIIATGTHTPMAPADYSRILPQEIINRYPVTSHDCDDIHNMVFLGLTKAGTPVSVNKLFFESNLKIVIGNIEPHHFMGFSGGAKSASIGLTSRETINKNHQFLLDPSCCAGTYESNPMRMDVEEIGEMIGVHMALNVILNGKKEIVEAIIDTPRAVMQQGIIISKRICQVPVKSKFDFVIASVGGAPKDINLYQSQKGLTHGAMITRDGGNLLLLAKCPEGLGSTGFENFLDASISPAQMIEKFAQHGFEVGPHKAFQLAREASRIQMYLHSSLSPENTKKSMLIPTLVGLNQTIMEILAKLPSTAKIAIMPRATNTIPDIFPG